MYAQPTTTVSILSSTTVNDYGDTVNSDTASVTNVPCALLAGTKQVWLPDSGQTRQVTYISAWVPSTTVVGVGDRIKDEQDSTIYVVAGVIGSQSALTTLDTSLDLQKV